MGRWKRSTRLWVVGGMIVAGGLGLAIASLVRDQQSVRDFVRLPAGCETSVEVTKAATYLVYYEFKGSVADIGGCTNDDRTYDLAPIAPGTRIPDGDLSVSVVDTAGNQSLIGAPAEPPASYRTPNFEGTEIGRVALDPGTKYTFAVTSADERTVLALGRSVDTTSSSLLLSGAAVLFAGLMIMGAALVVSLRDRRRVMARPIDWGPPSLDDRAPTTSAEP